MGLRECREDAIRDSDKNDFQSDIGGIKKDIGEIKRFLSRIEHGRNEDRIVGLCYVFLSLVFLLRL